MTTPHDENTYRAEYAAFGERCVSRVALFNAERDAKYRGYTVETRELAQSIADDFAFVDSWAAPAHLAPFGDLRKTTYGFIESFDRSAEVFGYTGQRTGEKVIVGGDFSLVDEDRNHLQHGFEGTFISLHLDGGVQVALSPVIAAEFVRIWTAGLAASGHGAHFTALSGSGSTLTATYPNGEVEQIAPDAAGRYRIPLLRSPLRILPVPGTAVDSLYREPTEAGAAALRAMGS